MRLFIPSSNDIKRYIRKEMEKRPDYAQNPEARLGTVAAFTTGQTKVSVILDGDTQAASYSKAKGYYPVIGDRVRLERQGNTWIIMDSVGASISPRVQTGTVTNNVPQNATSNLQAVNFPIPFDTTPNVVINFGSGSGNLARWFAKALTITPTGFLSGVYSGDGSGAVNATATTNQYIAILPGTIF